MALSVADKDKLYQGLMSYWSQDHTLTNFVKQVIRDAIDDADTYGETNQTAMKTALNLSFRTNASATQITFLYAVIFLARFDPASAKRLLGVS